MKNVAIKFISALALVAMFGTVAATAACPAAEGEGEGE